MSVLGQRASWRQHAQGPTPTSGEGAAAQALHVQQRKQTAGKVLCRMQWANRPALQGQKLLTSGEGGAAQALHAADSRSDR
jgi:hypothetical protein